MPAISHIANCMMNILTASLGAAALIAVAAAAALGGVVFKVRNWRNARKVDTAVALAVSIALHAAVLFYVFNVAFTPARLQGGGAGLGVRLEQSSSQYAGSGGVDVAIADPAEAGAQDPPLEPVPLQMPDRALLEVQPAVSVAVEMTEPPDLLQTEDPFAKAFAPARLAGITPEIPGAVILHQGERTLQAESVDGVASRHSVGKGEGGSSSIGAGSGQDAGGSGLAHDAGGGGGGETGNDSGVVMPAYPRESREKGEEGRVVVSVAIHADGTLGDIKVVESSGYSRLDEAALEAVRHSTFIPATRFGMPVDSTKKIAFTFRLKEE